jgi:hypothetical protein
MDEQLPGWRPGARAAAPATGLRPAAQPGRIRRLGAGVATRRSSLSRACTESSSSSKVPSCARGLPACRGE